MIDLKVDDHILIVTITGAWSLSEATVLQDEAADIVKKHVIRSILFDVRQSILEGSMIDFYRSVESHTGRLSRSVKVAVVLSPKGAAMPEVKFALTVALNRSVPLQIFTEIEVARDWLLGDGEGR